MLLAGRVPVYTHRSIRYPCFAPLSRSSSRSSSSHTTTMASAAAGGLLHGDTFFLDNFAVRQVRGRWPHAQFLYHYGIGMHVAAPTISNNKQSLNNQWQPWRDIAAACSWACLEQRCPRAGPSPAPFDKLNASCNCLVFCPTIAVG